MVKGVGRRGGAQDWAATEGPAGPGPGKQTLVEQAYPQAAPSHRGNERAPGIPGAPAAAQERASAIGRSIAGSAAINAPASALPPKIPAGPLVDIEVTERVTEKVEAPPEHHDWNLDTWWDAKFHLTIEDTNHTCVVTLRLFTNAPDDVWQKWEAAIEAKWTNKYSLAVLKPYSSADIYPIRIGLVWVKDAAKAHNTILPQRPGDTTDGRAGVGATSGMTKWGVNDTQDVTHELGHLLGNTDEYFKTNGVDYTDGGSRTGFRDKGGGIMNNPSEDPFARHYELIGKHAGIALGTPVSVVKNGVVPGPTKGATFNLTP